MDERDLIKAARGGDPSAYESLVRSYFTQIYHYTARFLGSEAEAEDAAQHTFIKAWRALKTFDASSPFKPWLFRIARNTSIDIARKRRDIPLSVFDSEEGAAEELFADDAPSLEELAARSYEERDVQRALGSLPKPDQEILFLHFHDGLPFREIGEITGRPLHTVKSRARRALLTLRKHLDAPKDGADT